MKVLNELYIVIVFVISVFLLAADNLFWAFLFELVILLFYLDDYIRSFLIPLFYDNVVDANLFEVSGMGDC